MPSFRRQCKAQKPFYFTSQIVSETLIKFFSMKRNVSEESFSMSRPSPCLFFGEKGASFFGKCRNKIIIMQSESERASEPDEKKSMMYEI